MLSLESTSARMSNLARQELYFRRFYSLDEICSPHRSGDARRRAVARAGIFSRRKNCRHRARALNGFALDRARARLLTVMSYDVPDQCVHDRA